MAGSFLGDSVRWQNGFARAWHLEYQGKRGPITSSWRHIAADWPRPGKANWA